MPSKIENRKSKIQNPLLLLCPRRFCSSGVTEITVEELQESGIETVLLDLDNTLVGWQRRDIPEAVRAWLAALKTAGMKLCLVSNTRFGKRLRALSEELDVPYVRHAWKPRRKGFLAAMKELKTEPSKTVMIGDQMFTDVLGGNRAGVFTVMVRPMARREFIGTKISRLAERALLAWFRRRGYL
jgi:HAD superfamily phosphatase (TIGR01668 family)